MIMSHKAGLVAGMAAMVMGSVLASDANAVIVKTSADALITENGAAGAAVSGGNGTGTSIAIRWNGASNNDRNEVGVFKFNLGAINKADVNDVSLNVFMHRGNSNNSGKNLLLYALNPGTAGEDWAEAGINYAAFPGLSVDGTAATRGINGSLWTNLGTLQLPASPALDVEGTLVSLPITTIVPLINAMGSNNFITVMVSYETSSNGTWNVVSREATASATNVLSGSAGDFAAYLDIGLIPEPTSLCLLALGGLALLRRRS
jgi:hypothetical protein